MAGCDWGWSGVAAGVELQVQTGAEAEADRPDVEADGVEVFVDPKSYEYLKGLTLSTIPSP